MKLILFSLFILISLGLLLCFNILFTYLHEFGHIIAIHIIGFILSKKDKTIKYKPSKISISKIQTIPLKYNTLTKYYNSLTICGCTTNPLLEYLSKNKSTPINRLFIRFISIAGSLFVIICSAVPLLVTLVIPHLSTTSLKSILVGFCFAFLAVFSMKEIISFVKEYNTPKSDFYNFLHPEEYGRKPQNKDK